MNLLGIVSVSGKGGLFKVIGQNKTGFILESLDEQKTKIVIGATGKLATLEDITVFGEDEDIALKSIFATMHEKKEEVKLPDIKGDASKIKAYFSKVAPGHDPDRVYVSDMKKIINWYSILSVLPLFTEEPAEQEVK